MKHRRGKAGTIRRVIKHASICLLLGAVVNVGVAWGYSWFSPGFIPGRRYWDLQSKDDVDGIILHVWANNFPSDRYQESPPPWEYQQYRNSGVKYDLILFPQKKSGPYITLQLVQAGFPMNCLSYHYWTEYDNNMNMLEHFDSRFALFCKQPSPSDTWQNRIVALPLRPLWPAFAINTIFYGVILWILFGGPFVVRRWQRVRRGLCTKCGYDLRGDFESGCSECGWNRNETEKREVE